MCARIFPLMIFCYLVLPATDLHQLILSLSLSHWRSFSVCVTCKLHTFCVWGGLAAPIEQQTCKCATMSTTILLLSVYSFHKCYFITAVINLYARERTRLTLDKIEALKGYNLLKGNFPESSHHYRHHREQWQQQTRAPSALIRTQKTKPFGSEDVCCCTLPSCICDLYVITANTFDSEHETKKKIKWKKNRTLFSFLLL